ncbi:MAG: hypothetical protein Salg2KO_10560 [Salibacteraceae bacterium]
MYNMTTRHLIIALIAVGFSLSTWAQKAPGTVNTLGGKAIFIESNPKTQFRHIGTIECAIISPDKFDLMMDHMVLKRVEKVYPEIEYDAVVFRPNTAFRKADIIKFYPDPEAGRRRDDDEINPDYLRSETIGRNGLNLFIENEPTGDYQVLGKIELPQNFTSTDFQKIMSEMIRVSRLNYPNLNGIVFTPGTGLSKAVVIKI